MRKKSSQNNQSISETTIFPSTSLNPKWKYSFTLSTHWLRCMKFPPLPQTNNAAAGFCVKIIGQSKWPMWRFSEFLSNLKFDTELCARIHNDLITWPKFSSKSISNWWNDSEDFDESTHLYVKIDWATYATSLVQIDTEYYASSYLINAKWTLKKSVYCKWGVKEIGWLHSFPMFNVFFLLTSTLSSTRV